MWLSWLEHCPVDLKVAGSIPGNTHTQVAGLIPCWGMYAKATSRCFSLTLMSVCLPVSLSLSVSLKSNEKMTWVRIKTKLGKKSKSL